MNNNPPSNNNSTNINEHNLGVTRPLGIDFSEFSGDTTCNLPNYSKDLSLIDEIGNSHKTIKDILVKRMNSLRMLATMWQKGNLAETIKSLVLMKDTGVSNDFFNYTFMKNGMNKDYLKLEQSVELLPLVLKLIKSKYEPNFRVGIKMVCMLFDMYSSSILIVKRSQKVNQSSEDSKIKYEHLITFFDQVSQMNTIKNRNLENDQNLKALVQEINDFVDTCKRANN